MEAKWGKGCKSRTGSLPVWYVSKGENWNSLVLLLSLITDKTIRAGSFLLWVKLKNELLPFKIYISNNQKIREFILKS